jgi:succinate-semialdehyde dehydrogenase/glutarate-semialdehyde dehydrogenase
MLPGRLLIGGQWREATGGRELPVTNPADGSELAAVADATPDDALAALDAAVAAQARWAATPARERSEILRRSFEEILAKRDELARIITLEMGKPLADAHAEINYGAEFFRWLAEEAVRIDGGYKASPSGSGRIVVMRQLVGPALLITPWNFPLAMATRKIGPALAAGCTVVLKPAEQTPLTTLALTGILEKCGVPAGVVNVVTTSVPGPAMSALLRDSRLRKMSFTGSTEVGRLLLAQAAETMLRTSMELGGNAPFLVFYDAVLDAAIDGALLAKLLNVGTGMVGLNEGVVSNAAAPFGGVKQSGLGREGGPSGIDEYLETKYLSIAV